MRTRNRGTTSICRVSAFGFSGLLVVVFSRRLLNIKYRSLSSPSIRQEADNKTRSGQFMPLRLTTSIFTGKMLLYLWGLPSATLNSCTCVYNTFSLFAFIMQRNHPRSKKTRSKISSGCVPKTSWHVGGGIYVPEVVYQAHT